MSLALKIKPPYFITFEGGEGAGKTTLINSLKLFLEQGGSSVLVTREPGGTPIGDAIRNLVLHRDKNVKLGAKAELLLFLSARAQHVEEVIAPALKNGILVLCDRFSDSSVAYQGYARGMGMKEVEVLSAYATNDIVPNLTLYFDLDPRIGLERAAKVRDADLFEDLKVDFHHLVREGFLEIAKNNPERVKVIDASKTQEKVLAQVLSILRGAIA